HLFPPTWKMSHTFLKFSTPILECVGCLYNMDEDDEKWLNEYNSKSGNNLSEDDFEEIMEFLENQAKNKPHLLAKRQLPSWEECQSWLPDKLLILSNDCKNVYSYWKSKRNQRFLRYKTVAPLMFELKVIEHTAETKDEEDNPYVCFRRRELKPIRKTRRTETQSFDKLRRIRRDVHNGREIIVKVKAREIFKKQRIELNQKIFIKECDIKEMRKELGIQNNSISDSQQRNKNRRISTSSIDTIGSLRTKPGTKSSKKDKESCGINLDVTHNPYCPMEKPRGATFYRKFDADKLMLPPAFRSRYGRGGRKRHEDFQNLGAFRTKIQKDKQNSPRQCSRDDGQVSINNLSTQNHSQNSAQANVDPRVSLSGSQSRPSSDVRSNSEPRAEGSSSRGNPDSRITIDMDSSRPNILPRTVVDQRSVRPNYDPNLTSRTANNLRTYIDPRTFSDPQNSAQIPIRDQRVNSAIPVSISNRDQHLSTDINVSRDQLLNT
ncbi:21950_t:CDS:2, partial [Racocetra persica]